MELLDSAEQLYLLPVTQANLLEQEELGGLLGLSNSHRSFNKNNNYYKYKSGKLFNNFVIYNSKNEKSAIVFDKRVSISEYHFYKKNNQQYVIIVAANSDTNKDKYINDEDLQKLFIYEVKTDRLQQIKANEAYTVNRIFQNNQTTNVIGQFGLDRNKDGEFKMNREPLIYYKIDVEQKKLIEIVTDEQILKLQNLLEGR